MNLGVEAGYAAGERIEDANRGSHRERRHAQPLRAHGGAALRQHMTPMQRINVLFPAMFGPLGVIVANPD